MSSEQKNVSPHILDNLPSEMLEIILDNLSFKDLLNCMTVCTKFYSFVTTSEKLNGKIKLVIDMKNFFENSEISTVLLRSLRPFANICVMNDIHRSEENLLKRLFSNLGENAVSLGIGPSENQMLINLDFFSEILNLMPNIRSLTLNNVGFISGKDFFVISDLRT